MLASVLVHVKPIVAHAKNNPLNVVVNVIEANVLYVKILIDEKKIRFRVSMFTTETNFLNLIINNQRQSRKKRDFSFNDEIEISIFDKDTSSFICDYKYLMILFQKNLYLISTSNMRFKNDFVVNKTY